METAKNYAPVPPLPSLKPPLHHHSLLPYQLAIVRDLADLDAAPDAPARDVMHGHEGLDAENEAVKMVARRVATGGGGGGGSAAPSSARGASASAPASEAGDDGGGGEGGEGGGVVHEIPTPAVAVVPSWHLDYLPTYRIAPSYVRARPPAVVTGVGGGAWGGLAFVAAATGATGGGGVPPAGPPPDAPDTGRFGVSAPPPPVEYDADTDDEAWLASVNGDGQERLPRRTLEELLWRLELANAAATDAALSAAGALAAERASVAAAATTDHLPKRDAIAALAAATGLRGAVLGRVVDLWRRKRARAARPLLRRLRAPTAAADTNPFHVFRPRERAHRPQTRRRREAGDDAGDRLRALAANLRKAADLSAWVARREERKRALACVDAAAAQLALASRGGPRSAVEAAEADAAAVARSRVPRRPAALVPAADGGPPPRSASDAAAAAAKLEALAKAGDPVASLPPPPPAHPPPDFPPARVTAALLASVDWSVALVEGGRGGGEGPLPPPDFPRGGRAPRAGRCGLLWFDPPPPTAAESIAASTPDPKPLWERPNPYGPPRPGAVLEVIAAREAEAAWAKEKEAAAAQAEAEPGAEAGAKKGDEPAAGAKDKAAAGEGEEKAADGK